MSHRPWRRGERARERPRRATRGGDDERGHRARVWSGTKRVGSGSKGPPFPSQSGGPGARHPALSSRSRNETGRTCAWRFLFSAPVTRDERLLGSVPSLGARRAASGSRRVQDWLIRRRYRGCSAGGQGCRSLLAPLRQHASLSSSAHLGGTRQPLSQRAAAREQGAGAG